jgi:hypothetical protein
MPWPRWVPTLSHRPSRPWPPRSSGRAPSGSLPGCIAKRDLLPTEVNLRPAYGSFAELEQACAAFCGQVNARAHREAR